MKLYEIGYIHRHDPNEPMVYSELRRLYHEKDGVYAKGTFFNPFKGGHMEIPLSKLVRISVDGWGGKNGIPIYEMIALGLSEVDADEDSTFNEFNMYVRMDEIDEKFTIDHIDGKMVLTNV